MTWAKWFNLSESQFASLLNGTDLACHFCSSRLLGDRKQAMTDHFANGKGYDGEAGISGESWGLRTHLAEEAGSKRARQLSWTNRN